MVCYPCIPLIGSWDSHHRLLLKDLNSSLQCSKSISDGDWEAAIKYSCVRIHSSRKTPKPQHSSLVYVGDARDAQISRDAIAVLVARQALGRKYLVLTCASGYAIFKREDGNSHKISVRIIVVRVAFGVERDFAGRQSRTGHNFNVGRGEGGAIARGNEAFSVGILEVLIIRAVYGRRIICRTEVFCARGFACFDSCIEILHCVHTWTRLSAFLLLDTTRGGMQTMNQVLSLSLQLSSLLHLLQRQLAQIAGRR